MCFWRSVLAFLRGKIALAVPIVFRSTLTLSACASLRASVHPSLSAHLHLAAPAAATPYTPQPTHTANFVVFSLYFCYSGVILVFTIFSRYIAFGDILICGCIPILSQSVRLGIPTSPYLFPRHYEESLIKGI